MTSSRVISAQTPEQRAAAVAAALAALRGGEPVGVPTDTVYGLAAGASDPGAVQKLFELKGRPAERRIAVLVADQASAESLVLLTPQARLMAQRYWPGPLTLVADRAPGAPSHLGDDATIGVRVPDDEVVRAIAASHGPLAVTSANLHGGPTPSTADGVAEQFPTLRLVIDGGPRPGASSTVVDVTGTTPVVLREGPISLDEILSAAQGSMS